MINKSLFFVVGCLISSFSFGQQNPLTANAILDKVDKNMISESQIISSEMIVYGKRKSRTIRSKGYAVGTNKSFTEYFYPEREKGTKMLKVEDRLWIYSPSSDRIIQISGHLLRQSLMGSDLSYEDMMEERKLREVYTAKILGDDRIGAQVCWKMELTAKVPDISYFKRIIWVDKSRFVPLREELFAKSGQLLKRTELSEIKKIQGRWYPTKINYKDVLKAGKGTDFIIKEIAFNVPIADQLFLKSTLKK